MNKKEIRQYKTAKYLQQQGSSLAVEDIFVLINKYPIFQLWPHEDDTKCYVCGHSPFMNYGDSWVAVSRHMGCAVHLNCLERHPDARFGI